MSAQGLPDFGIPDSSYVLNQLLVWFKEGALNLEMLGEYCEMPDYPHSSEGTGSLPLDNSFILSSSLLSYMQQRGVVDMHKVIPWLDPFRDTLSVSRRGDTIRVQPLWNLLLLEFDPQREANVIYEAWMLLALHNDKVLWAQPNFVYTLGNTLNPKQVAEFDFKKITQPNDMYFYKQLSLQNIPEGIHVENAWTKNSGSADVKIAIIDDGIYDSNPDFRGKIAKIKDYVPLSLGSKLHGTDMAGIIGARKDDNTGVAGIAGGTQADAGSQLYILDTFPFDTRDVLNAILEASTATTSTKGFGCHAINVSLYRDIRDALLRLGAVTAYMHGVTLSACMGNTSNSVYPVWSANSSFVAQWFCLNDSTLLLYEYDLTGKPLRQLTKRSTKFWEVL